MRITTLADSPKFSMIFCLHSVSADVLAACIMTVRHATTDILVMCDYFVADLFLWIQAHWFGQVRDSQAT